MTLSVEALEASKCTSKGVFEHQNISADVFAKVFAGGAASEQARAEALIPVIHYHTAGPEYSKGLQGYPKIKSKDQIKRFCQGQSHYKYVPVLTM